GILLNLAFVDGVQDGFVIVNNEMLVISRGRKKDFMEELTNYLGGAI
ncbi:MAG: DNA-binding response regulator, partial [Clostridiales bacterium]|nr:DNA-binding response regulator [Clostridiales bacterium]